MFHVPDVRPEAVARDTVTTPSALVESTIVPENTLGDGPGTYGNSIGLVGAVWLQAISIKPPAATQIPAYAIPGFFDVAREPRSSISPSRFESSARKFSTKPSASSGGRAFEDKPALRARYGFRVGHDV